MNKYDILLKILDAIIKEAPSSMSKKYPSNTTDSEQINQARARAFIHLYLKVSFGLLDFTTREHYITDGAFDGGIDGYYINQENKTIYLIQSKFRKTEKNFENKEISLQEILVMDVNRILDGEEADESENLYIGKIKQLQREISNIDNIARYSYRVIILANIPNVKQSDLLKLSGGISCEVINFEKCYDEFVFPVIGGTFYSATDLRINIDLSNKNAGSKISYTVQTRKGECEITVLFVPTIELGRIMYTYKNSILKYNPRSYLGHEGKNVNESIKETIINKTTNEFALFNNGVTMLSDETNLNERIGKKNQAQLIVKNPQIINGGQTSFTLSRIYEENIDKDVDKVFQNKEVLLKIITLVDNSNLADKIDLINEISEATNKQTPVIGADRLSNESLQVKLQKKLFDTFGLLYERKRGEFNDGIYNNYISENLIMERNLFFRMYYASNGMISKAKQKKLFIKHDLTFEELTEEEKLNNTYFGYLCFKKINKAKHPNQTVDLQTYAKIFAMVILYKPTVIDEFTAVANQCYIKLESKWKNFIGDNSDKFTTSKNKFNKYTNEFRVLHKSDFFMWFDSTNFKNDIIDYFKE